jgi:predicted RNase H-like nuclease (RuvC/YqgF family)
MEYKIPVFRSLLVVTQPVDKPITHHELKRELARGAASLDQIEHELQLINYHLQYQYGVQHQLQQEIHEQQRRIVDLEQRIAVSYQLVDDLKLVRKRLYDRRYFHRKEEQKHGREYPLAGSERPGTEED